MTAARDSAASLQEEVHQLRNELSSLREKEGQIRADNSLLPEVDVLRAQLNDVRKQLMKRELEESSAGVINPRNFMERETQGRQV